MRWRKVRRKEMKPNRVRSRADLECRHGGGGGGAWNRAPAPPHILTRFTTRNDVRWPLLVSDIYRVRKMYIRISAVMRTFCVGWLSVACLCPTSNQRATSRREKSPVCVVGDSTLFEYGLFTNEKNRSVKSLLYTLGVLALVTY